MVADNLNTATAFEASPIVPKFLLFTHVKDLRALGYLEVR